MIVVSLCFATFSMSGWFFCFCLDCLCHTDALLPLSAYVCYVVRVLLCVFRLEFCVFCSY